MTQFTISVVSDSVCPWCYVGRKKLGLAISLYKRTHPNTEDTFVTTWFPYYLNPDAPPTSVDKRTFYAQKFGPDRAAAMFERIGSVGREVGINFSFGGKTGSTRDSHRLIRLGREKGNEVQTKIVDALFEAYFEKEEDITTFDVLMEAGVKAGLKEEEVKAWLEGDNGGKEVDAEVDEARRNGVHGVPNFTLQGKYEIGGAQEPEAFVKIFEQVKALEG